VQEVQKIVTRIACLPLGKNMYEITSKFSRDLQLQLRVMEGFFLNVFGKLPRLERSFTEFTDLIGAFGVLSAVERASDVKYRMCAKEDCRQLLNSELRRKIFCSIKCAHCVAVRNSRKRNRHKR
jgi:hypothetical protein